MLETLHGVRDTSLPRPVWSRNVRPVSLETPSEPKAIRDCAPTSQRLDPKHRVQTARNDVSDIPCDIEPHPDLAQWFPSRLWLVLVSRSGGVFLCVAVVVARLVCLSHVSLFWGVFSRGLFLVLALSCFSAFVARVQFFSVSSEPDRFDGLNIFCPSWTELV